MSNSIHGHEVMQMMLELGGSFTSESLKQAIEVLKGVEGISFTFFQSGDVVRHPLVARIVQAYERFEHRQ